MCMCVLMREKKIRQKNKYTVRTFFGVRTSLSRCDFNGWKRERSLIS